MSSVISQERNSIIVSRTRRVYGCLKFSWEHQHIDPMLSATQVSAVAAAIRPSVGMF